MGTAFLYGNGGSGGTGATLTVTAPAGCTVTVSKDGKTKTKTAGADGLAVFKGLETGTWTVTITDGGQTAQKTVAVTADYSTGITFFSATIHVTYPEWFTCTATDGVTTLAAPDTSGKWACVVPNAGTWTVSLNNLFREVVSITDNGQIVTIDKWYLYKNGNEYNGLTGGWQGRGWPTSSDFKSIAPTIVKTNNYIKAKKESGAQSSGVLETVNDIDVNGFKALNIDLLYEKSGSAAWARILLSTNRNSQYALDNMCASLDLEDSDANVRKTVSLDISAINTDVDVCINLRGQSNPTSQITMYNMWLE